MIATKSRTMTRALLAGAVIVIAASLGAAPATAQKLTKVKYAEVVRSVFYLPKYVAIAKGYFADQGIEVDMTTAWGGDKGLALLMTGRTDIALLGPESAVYVENSASPLKTKMFAAVTATDGVILVSREKMTMEQFKWSMIRGKSLMGMRIGGTPNLFAEFTMKKYGINPKKDLDFFSNIAIPNRVGAWVAKKGDYALFFEPDIAKLERQGLAYPVASVGKEIGPVDYTVFMATDDYIKKNPAIIQGWTNAIHKAQKWVQTADATEAATTVAKWFPSVKIQDIVASVLRYRKFGIWKTDPTTHPEAIDALQDILIEGGVMKASQRVKYESIVVTDFSEKAKKTVK